MGDGYLANPKAVPSKEIPATVTHPPRLPSASPSAALAGIGGHQSDWQPPLSDSHRGQDVASLPPLQHRAVTSPWHASSSSLSPGLRAI